MIRTSFKEEDATFRHRNVAKLLFVHMLGYPSHFGQMECLKLIASPRFLDKRIGYLALSLLVEESSEVLTLVTNSLSSDLGHRNQFVQGLALAALGNISNKDMLRDLTSQVLKLLTDENSYVRKKAALCAIQIFRKVPDMVEEFVPVAMSLLKEKNHAIKLTATTALWEIASKHPSFVKKVRKTVPILVQNLKQALLSGYDREYTINSISDPFLQVQVLRLLGVLGQGHSAASEAMSDILAQVATNTEASRNTGNAILYECVRTIFSIDCEDGLRVLAVNILGRFLQNRDNNIRYVALTMLGKVIAVDKDAVKRHQDTIVDCLRDSDVSIRLRAIDLVFALLSRDSIGDLSKEVLNYLVLATPDQKKEMSSRLSAAAVTFAPNKKWHVHTLISMLCIAGSAAPNNIWETATALIGQPEAEEFRTQAVHRLFVALKEDASQIGLVNAAVWALGEFAPLLQQSCEKFEEDGYYDTASESDVIDLLESTRNRHDSTGQCRSMIMTAYVKLYARFHETKPQLAQLLQAYNTSMNVELQARSCEFSEMVAGEIDPSWLAQMPVPTDEEMAQRRVVADVKSEDGSDGSDDDDDDSDDSSSPSDEDEAPRKSSKSKAKAKAPAADSANLLDFTDVMNGDSGSSSSAAPANSGGNSIDLLADIFGGGGDGGSGSSAPAPPAPSGGSDDLLSMFGGGGGDSGGASTNTAPQVPTQQQQPEFPPMLAFEGNGIKITMTCKRGQKDKHVIVVAQYVNTGASEISNFVFQAAVPKFITLKMEPPSGNTLPAFSAGAVQQQINLLNSMQGTKPIAMKVKISFSRDGASVVEQATIQNFPSGL